jgi:hypothetical protein
MQAMQLQEFSVSETVSFQLHLAFVWAFVEH